MLSLFYYKADTEIDNLIDVSNVKRDIIRYKSCWCFLCKRFSLEKLLELDSARLLIEYSPNLELFKSYF